MDRKIFGIWIKSRRREKLFTIETGHCRHKPEDPFFGWDIIVIVGEFAQVHEDNET